jgi:hypothetical protein
MNHDFLWLYLVPPKGVARYRQAFFTSGAKSDVSGHRRRGTPR